MKDIPLQNVRNFVVAGHAGSGKTSLCDVLLSKLSVTDKPGSPAAGTSLCDYTEEEISRKMTLYAKPLSGVYQSKNAKTLFMFIDTPGTDDFFGQVQCAVQAADAALIVVDAVGGIQVGTRAAWRCCESQKLPRAVAVTGLDREGANYEKIMQEIKEVFGAACVPVTVWDNGGVASLLAECKNAALAEARNVLIEKAAETQDALIEKFLGGETLTAAEIQQGLRQAFLSGALIPIFVVLPLKGAGVLELLDGITQIFPSPAERKVFDAGGQEIKITPEAPFSGFVWRVLTDPYAGKQAFVRVMSGTLREGDEIFNASRGAKEVVGAFFVGCGKKQVPAWEEDGGDLIAIPKLKNTAVNETLCAAGQKIVFKPVVFRNPVVFSAVFTTDGDDDKIGIAIGRAIEDDPTLKLERNHETNEMIISGMGDAHLELVRELAKKRSNINLEYRVPKVSYRETVTALGEGHYKHKKQSGGRGQYAEVYAKVRPLAEGEEWFEDAVVGGVIPRNFIPACEKGFVDAMQHGVLAGYPVVNVRVTVYDGSYHEVDSSEIAFKIAASRAFKEAMTKAKPVLLEPIMTVKVMVPDQYMGDINGDLNHRRGRILGVDVQDGLQVITADVPQAELFRYCSELRSITGGRGSFEMQFARYDIVPSNIAQKIIANAAKTKEEEE